MSAPKVDVITVRWDAKTAMYRVDRPNWDGGKVVMYDAVAELIEAAKFSRLALAWAAEQRPEFVAEYELLDAALARIGGAA